MTSTDPELLELFQEELHRTRDPQAAIHAVRLRVEEEVRLEARRKAWGEGGRRGPAAAVVGFITEERFERICELTADEFGVPAESLRKDPRRHCLHARWVVAALLRCYGMSYPQVARALRMTDHTRAIEGVRKVEGAPELAGARDRVVAALRVRGWPLPAWVPGQPGVRADTEAVAARWAEVHPCATRAQAEVPPPPPGECGTAVPFRKASPEVAA